MPMQEASTSTLTGLFPEHAGNKFGIKSILNKLTPRPVQTFNKAILPQEWSSHSLNVDGEQATIFYSPAKDPRAVAVYISGLQSSPLGYVEGINRLREQGISVISLSLLPATQGDLSGEKCRFVKRNSRLFEEALFNPKSKIHGMGDEDLPRYIVPHSTASLVLQYTLAHGDNHDRALELFDGACNLNPFFDAGLASKRNPVRCRAYELFAKAHANDAILSTRTERIVMRTKRTENDYFYDTPTHGLILGILEKSRPFVERLLENPDAIPKESGMNFPQTFIIGTNDTLVCNATTQDVADALGSPVHKHPIDHSGALHHEESLERLIETIKTPRIDRYKGYSLPFTSQLGPVLNRIF